MGLGLTNRTPRLVHGNARDVRCTRGLYSNCNAEAFTPVRSGCSQSILICVHASYLCVGTPTRYRPHNTNLHAHTIKQSAKRFVYIKRARDALAFDAQDEADALTHTPTQTCTCTTYDFPDHASRHIHVSRAARLEICINMLPPSGPPVETPFEKSSPACV